MTKTSTSANHDDGPGSTGAELRLSVPPDPHLGRYVRQQVVAFADAVGVAEHEVSDLVTAIGEALANAIEHAGTPEPIEIAAWIVGDDQMVATVADRGRGFRHHVPSDLRLPDGLCERGRGLAIMRCCSDVFSIRTAPGRGTTITMVRRLSHPAVAREGSGNVAC